MADQNINVKIDLDLVEFNKHAKELSAVISQVLGRDIQVINTNLDKTAQAAGKAGNAMGKAGKAAGGAGQAVKSANMQWTSLALVIQDLPFGFRGIQNNLPAVAGSLAGVAGPAYLAFSALVAAITAYDMGLFGATKTTDNFAKSLAETNKELKNSINYTSSEISSLESLVRIGTNLNNSESTRKKALQEIKDILGQVNKEEAAKITNMGQAILAVNLYTEAIKAQQLQEVSGKRIAELQMDLIEKRFLLEKKKTTTKREFNLLQQFLGYPDLQNLESDVLNAEALVRRLEELNESAVKANLNNPFSKFNKPNKGDTAKLDQDKSLLERLKKEQKLYKDNLGMFYHYGSLIIKEEERLAIERANFEKASSEEIKNIRAGFLADMIVNQQEYGRAIMSEADKATKAYEEIERKIGEIIVKNRENIAEALGKINADINKENIKNVTDELGVTLNATRRNYRAQKEAYEMAIAKLKEKKAALEAAGIATTGYADAIANLETRMSGLVDPLEELNQKLQNLFDQFKIDLLVGFGEAIADMADGGDFDFSRLGTILADGLINIGKALIQYGIMQAAAIEALKSLNPGVAIAGGVLAVAAGMFLKSKLAQQKTTKFANGGIVSGPTMGLMGEYPGAKNNPEVIAPLDKLKSMIGGGNGGTFVLRGQDLLLATNRAQKASNLKGQNISLA
jgi:hypothetical protein